MKTYLSLKNEHQRALPEEFQHDDVRYTEGLVEQFLGEFTRDGDVVFDPFMGYGTTLVVAERLNRVAFGVEFEERRWRYVQTILQNPERALHGDSTKLASMKLPDFDFSITSPPYMGRHHKENPFTAYSTVGEGYGKYLETMRQIYHQLNAKLKPSGRAVIEVSNLKHEDGTLTTLAWDIATEISKVLRFQGEIVVTWDDGYGYGYDHSYCLVFAKM
ncbi:MAG: DNA methylase [Candidatus Melainabacteria bacterium]|nr:MAG: DNA methylase [Candidatus Melainabacteria bacterium]